MQKLIFVAFTLIFLWTGLFGIFHSMDGMKANTDGTMNSCLLGGQTGICVMSIADHISLLQRMFTATPVVIIVFIFGVILLGRSILFQLFSILISRHKVYARKNFHIPLFDFLRLGFSQGILHPKTY